MLSAVEVTGARVDVVVDDVVDVVVEDVVIVGITKMVVEVDGVVDAASGGNVVVVDVVVVAGLPTTSVNIALLAKLKESPVHVPPVGLSRPYAYI